MRFEKRLIFVLLLMVFLAGGVFAQDPEPERVGTAETTVCCQKTNAGLYCQDVLEKDCSSESEFALPTACESTGPCNPGYCYDADQGTCLDNVPQMVCNDEGGTWSEERPASCNLGCCVLGDQAAFVTLVRCKRLSSFYGLETNFNPDIGNAAQCILTAKSDERGACLYEQDFETTCMLTTRSQCTENVGGDGFSDAVDEGSGATPDDAIFEELPDEGGDSEAGAEEEVDGEETDEVQESPPSGCEGVGGDVTFCPGMLCSAEELNTDCGPTEDTVCVEGKEEVYFVDTCGNPANIYDASKVNDDAYWTYMLDKTESCRPGAPNIDSQTCGNCNYLLGSYCSATTEETANPTYGDNICLDLNCPAGEMTGGEERQHGESWCLFDTDRDFTYQENTQNAFTDVLNDALGKVRSRLPVSPNFRGASTPVGGKFYRYICSHGEVIVEPCADFRQEECIESGNTGFSEAACRVNRWQDCTTQYIRSDCENSDQRDCVWMDGIQYVLLGGLSNGTVLDKSSLQAAKGELQKFNSGDRELGGCVPKTPPGLKFWGGDGEGESDNSEAASICQQANAMCPVTYEKGLVGGDWECVENCECLEKEAELARAQLCMSLGDCGPKVNYVGDIGRTTGYKVFEEELGGD